MLSILPAQSAQDFEAAALLSRGLAEWDALAVEPHGISAEEVMTIFHPARSVGELTTKFGAGEASFLIARWDGTTAGCLAFDPFDDDTMEIQKFFVDARFRGKGIGRRLMATALDSMSKGRRGVVILHTAFYMTDAIALYESAGFRRCPRYRETPVHVSHTDVFMSRRLPALEAAIS